MAEVNIEQLERYIAEIEKAGGEEAVRKVTTDALHEVAGRMINKTMHRTPIGQYPIESGRSGGTLRRGWTNGEDADALVYANSLPVSHTQQTHSVTIQNAVEYAPYVEFGHRTVSGGWVEGRFMMTKSADEMNAGEAQKVVQKHLDKYLEGLK